jgi:two-component system cell cycle response regulator DivK
MKKDTDKKMTMQQQKILIVDDDDRNIFALKAVLKSRQFNCVAASGGLQALEMLQQNKDVTVALIDMMMPDMDGYELMAIIKKIPALNPVLLVAVTAQAMAGDKEKCIAAGADDYIVKPVNVDLLLDILNGQVKQQL